MIPGEILIQRRRDRAQRRPRRPSTLTVANTGDRPIQVGSHYHFFETNPALKFDRKKARGMRLDIPAGTAVRFEPGQAREVTLVALAAREGLAGDGAGAVACPGVSRQDAGAHRLQSADAAHERKIAAQRSRLEMAGVDPAASAIARESHVLKIERSPMPTCSARPPATGCGSPTPNSSSRSRRTSPPTARR